MARGVGRALGHDVGALDDAPEDVGERRGVRVQASSPRACASRDDPAADTTTRSATTTAGGGPGMKGLMQTTRRRLQRELGPTAAAAVFVHNPARAFALRG